MVSQAAERINGLTLQVNGATPALGTKVYNASAGYGVWTGVYTKANVTFGCNLEINLEYTALSENNATVHVLDNQTAGAGNGFVTFNVSGLKTLPPDTYKFRLRNSPAGGLCATTTDLFSTPEATMIVAPAPTTTSVSHTGSQEFSAPLTFTANIGVATGSAAAGPFSGTVTFKATGTTSPSVNDGRGQNAQINFPNNVLGTVSVTNASTATLQLASAPFLAAFLNHQVTATFTPSGSSLPQFGASVPAPSPNATETADSVNIGKLKTAVTVTAPNPTAAGVGFTITTTVSRNASSTGSVTPTGLVELKGSAGSCTGGIPLCTNLGLVNGVATCVVSATTAQNCFPAPGGQTITATYKGDTVDYDNYLDSTTQGNPGTTTKSISPNATTINPLTALSDGGGAYPYGRKIKFEASIQNGPSNTQATGLYHFREGTSTGALICEGTLVAGTASCTNASLDATPHTVVLVYDGDGGHEGAVSNAVNFTITKNIPKVTLSKVPNADSTYGGAVAFHATVTYNGTPDGVITTPSGTITFFSNVPNTNTVVGGPVVVSNGADVSVSAANLLASNNHTISAQFNAPADSNFDTTSTGSVVSPNVSHKVDQARPTIQITGSSKNPGTAGESITLTATVSPPAGFPTGVGAPPLPIGTDTKVEWRDNGTIIAGTHTFTAYNGTDKIYRLDTADLLTGTHNITATYVGDANFLVSNPSGVLVQTMNITSGQVDTVQKIQANTNTAQGTWVDVSIANPKLGVNPAEQFSVKITNKSGSPPGLLDPKGKVTFKFASTTTGVTPPGAQEVSVGSTKIGAAAEASDVALTATYQSSPQQFLPGTYTVTADWSGDADHSPVANIPVGTLTVAKGDITLGVTASPSVYGNNVTPTAALSFAPSNPVPSYPPITGNVVFTDTAGNIPLGTDIVAGGAASVIANRLSAGGHTYTGAYSGDVNYNSKSTTSSLVAITAASTVTQMQASSVNPSNLNQPVTFGVVVRPCTGAATTACPNIGHGQPTGTVKFFDNTGSGPVAIAGTVTRTPPGPDSFPYNATDANEGALFTISPTNLTTGKHFITATYAADGNFTVDHAAVDTGVAGAPAGVVTQIVNTEGVTVTVTSSKNPSITGDSVTITATAEAFLATGTPTAPTGTITFKDGAADLGTVNLATLSGAKATATVTKTDLSIGTHAITATYNGDPAHAGGSAGTLAQVVGKAPSALVLTSSASPAKFGQSVTLSAKLTSAVAGTISGNVVFKDGTTTLGTTTVGADGTATFSTSALTVGSHSLSASYAGDANFLGSDGSFAQSVTASSSTTTLSSSSNPAGTNSTVTITATVAAVAPGAGTPTGTVTFTEGATTLGTGSLGAGGVATFQAVKLSEGSHNIIATYAGDTNFLGSASAAFEQKVSAGAVTITVTSSPNPSDFGQQVTMTATLTGGQGAATGQITFTTSSLASLGSATIDGTGKATFTTGILPPGTQTITATFGGDAKYGPGTGSVSHVVNKAGTTVAVTSSLNPSQTGSSVTFTAVVTSVATGVTGDVEFFDGTTSLGKVALVSATASVTTSALGVGTHSITATYAGNNSFNTSTSAAFAQVVSAPGSSSGDPDAGASSSSSSSSGSTGTSSSSSTGGTSSSGAGVDAGSVTVGGDSDDDGGCNTSNGDSGTTGAAAFLLVAGAVIVSRRRRQPTARR